MSEEAGLQKQCNEYLRKRGIKYFHIEKGRSKNKTHRIGWPDLTLFFNGEAFFVELKAPKKGLTPEQEEFKQWCYENNFAFVRVDDFDDFVEFVNKEIIK